ncbi:MAG: PQQ-binding-like beta-propeller repeat protein, partial [Myxococcales bacterium]|nr:PQQ-binding-like beta-propeller repeat protein [Myxococcales bacterium]
MLTRGISPRAWLRAGLLLVALPGCRDSATTTEPEARCRRDADCRQGQVCQGGACVNPADEAVVESPGATRAAAAFADASPGPAWRRGGPGLPHPATASGPRTAPTVAWELSLGAAISASPRLVTVEEEVLACVGAHQGRFVCAVVEGPRAGTVALELQLDGVVWGTAAVGPGPGDEARLYVGTDADTLHAIDVGTGAVVWSTRLGRCDPPRALGPMGVRCDVDGGPTVAVDGALVVGADGVYRVERDGAIAWRFDGAPADASAEDGADGAVAEGGAEDGADGATDGDE